MGNARQRFRWITRPQLLVGYIVLCLCVGACGSAVRGNYPSLAIASTVAQQVKGASVVESSPPVAPPDCAAVPCIALTFDDGPDPRTTPHVLDVLARNQIPATFFLVGREVPGREDIVRRIYQEGHEIGNHSWNHPNFTKLPPVAMHEEINATQAAIMAAGVPAPRLFRPPYGAVDTAVRTHVSMPIIRWDIDTEDWLTKDPAAIADHLLRDAHPGGIILMHDKYEASALALEPALQTLKQQYHFVTVSQLLGINSGDQGQFFNRLP